MFLLHSNRRSLVLFIDNILSEKGQLDEKLVLRLKERFLNLNFDWKYMKDVRCLNAFIREFSQFTQPPCSDLKPTTNNAKDRQNTVIEGTPPDGLENNSTTTTTNTMCDCVAFLRDYEANNFEIFSEISEPVLFILCLGDCHFLMHDYFEHLYEKLIVLKLQLEEEADKGNAQRDCGRWIAAQKVEKYFTPKSESETKSQSRRVSPGKTRLVDVLNIEISLLKFACDQSVLVNMCMRKISEIMDSQKNDVHGIKHFRDILNQLELFTGSNSALCIHHDFNWTNPVENPFYDLKFVRINKRFWDIEFRKKVIYACYRPCGVLPSPLSS